MRRKREALVSELFELARRAVDTRAMITERAAEAYHALLSALARHGHAGLMAIGWPTREIEVEIRARQVWDIAVADIVARPPLRRTLGARGTPPGSTGPAAVDAATRFEELVELVLDAATREILIRRLGEALTATTRKVNVLEQRVGPSLDRQIMGVRRVLDEREREEQGRLRHLARRKGLSAAVPPALR